MPPFCRLRAPQQIPATWPPGGHCSVFGWGEAWDLGAGTANRCQAS